MDPIALFTSTQGRLGRQAFWLGVAAVYVAGFASQMLLSGVVIGRSGVWAFLIVHGAVLWAWTALHIKRLRDAGRPAFGAIGVAVIYGLAIALLVLIIAFFTGVATTPGEERGDGALGFFLLLFILALLFSPDLGVFTLIIKMLLVIAFLPAVISAIFTLYTGMRQSVTPPVP